MKGRCKWTAQNLRKTSRLSPVLPMMDGQVEIVTGRLTELQIARELNELSEELAKRGVDFVLVEFGWGCDLPQDELWKSARSTPKDLPAFVTRSAELGVCRLGKSDVTARNPIAQFEIRLCHEGDVHVISRDPELIEGFRTRWLRNGYRGFQRTETGPWLPLLSDNPSG
jgi:hypothetical protein